MGSLAVEHLLKVVILYNVRFKLNHGTNLKLAPTRVAKGLDGGVVTRCTSLNKELTLKGVLRKFWYVDHHTYVWYTKLYDACIEPC